MENQYIYIAGFGDIEFDIIKKMSDENNYSNVVRVFEEHLDTKVELLKNTDILTGKTVKVRIILFENIDNKSVIKFINIFKTLQLPPAIFAIVTEHNKVWTFKQLATHLIKEHQEMTNNK